MDKPKRKRWRRTIDSFKVGQFYIRDFGKEGNLILLVTKIHPRGINPNRYNEGDPQVLTRVVMSNLSGDRSYYQRSPYTIGSTYCINQFEWPYIKLMRFKKEVKN